jgi:hypothetical protein
MYGVLGSCRLAAALREEMSAEIGRLAAGAARSLGCGAWMEAAETVIRAGMLKLGGGMLGRLLAADPATGHSGWCGLVPLVLAESSSCRRTAV